MTPPSGHDSVLCLPVPAFAATDLHAVRAAFHNATAIPLSQAWLDEPEPDFLPATVRTGWRDDTLIVFATMSDADVFTRAAHHNDRLWELGDTFEMFLQSAEDAPYVELHVTPNNLRLQLRFDRPPDPNAGGDSFSQALLPEDTFTSHAWVLPAAREWCVLAEVPVVAVSPDLQARGSTAPMEWRFSFCRYDYTRGRARPVISSSSAHTEPRFHRPKEWGRLRTT